MNKNLFNSVQMKRPQNNKFDLTHDVKMSLKMGKLYPNLVLECVPGDKFVLGSSTMVRFAPLLAPIMHRVDVFQHYFFVPNRLVWDNWETFITGGVDGVLPVHPYLTISEFAENGVLQLADYFGIPTPTNNRSEKVSALPFAAYNLIYNEYYRDQNLCPELDFALIDGQNDNDWFSLMNRAYEHDYFTSSLPFAQKGASVDIPLGDVVLKDDWTDGLTNVFPHWENAAGAAVGLNGVDIQAWTDGVFAARTQLNGTVDPIAYNPQGTLEVGSTTINDLRRAFRLQEWLEKNARGGTRYTEAIYSHFGVKSPDARLQRPEYITGTKSPVIISEVLNTTGTEDAPQGDMAGHAISVTGGKNGSYYCQEHGFIIGIMSVLPRTAYQQGLNRVWSKVDYLDYFFPTFAHLGEQEVQNREIFAFQDGGDGTWGYVPRYAEYKYQPSRVSGDFRTSLNYWHLGRIFANRPGLNQDFIECKPENVERIFAVQDGTDNIWSHVLHQITAIRPMPKFGTPTI